MNEICRDSTGSNGYNGNTVNTITAFTIILNNHGYHNQQQWGGIFSQLGRSCCFDSTVDCNVKTRWNNYLSKIGTTTFISNYRIVYSWQGLYKTLISTRQWLCFIDSSPPCNYCRITGFCLLGPMFRIAKLATCHLALLCRFYVFTSQVLR